jgi:CRISPR-associated protein Cas8c/Csp2
MTHPYLHYGYALFLAETNLEADAVLNKQAPALIAELQKSLHSFRVKPATSFVGMSSVKFTFCDEAKGDTSHGIFLAPNVIASDKAAGNLLKSCTDWIADVRSEQTKNDGKVNLDKMTKASMSSTPTSGEYLSFGATAGRGKPSLSTAENAFALLTSLTSIKPAMAYKTYSQGKIERSNTTIIPAFDSINDTIRFVRLFKLMQARYVQGEAMIGGVFQEKNKKGEVTKESPLRPKIYDGNFPHAPRSSALGPVALLGSIGAWAKEAEDTPWAIDVLESLKQAQMYVISYGKAQSFRYNHYLVDLAKENRLSEVVDSLFYTELLSAGPRTADNRNDYQILDLFTARFLLQFNRVSFRDFLAQRAEYPHKTSVLFTTYFEKMESIQPDVVQSAKALGRWLNYVAYRVAKDYKENATKDDIRKQKAKVLVELESSTFAAKSGDALIAQAITRAGRLSGMDAPEEGSLFMEQTAAGSITLDQAKNLLVAFSRLRNKYEPRDPDVPSDIAETQSDNTEGKSDAQE